jgi:hypothetical protein
VFVPQKEEVTVGWKELCTEELDDLYCSPDVTGAVKLRITWLECFTHWVCFVCEKLTEDDHLEDLVSWEDIIKFDLKELLCDGRDGIHWIRLAQQC